MKPRHSAPEVPMLPPKPLLLEVANYREAYGLFACSGILFNHESLLRPERFVTQKLSLPPAALPLAAEHLYLGDISVVRDWGWAPEYVEAMYLMLQQEKEMIMRSLQEKAVN